jgi:ribose transport system substrate-binding protein
LRDAAASRPEALVSLKAQWTPMPRSDHDPKPISPPAVRDERLADDLTESGAGRVPAVARAAAVLNALAAACKGLSLSELARITGAPKSSLLSVCLALTDERLIRRSGDGRYRLGTRVAELASAELLHPPRLSRVAVAVQTLTNPFFAAEARAVETHCRELHIAVALSDAGQDLCRQLQQLDAIVASSTDALILDAVDSDGVAEGVAQVRRSGILVVAVNAGATGADATVTTDNTQAGELIARHLAAFLNGAGTIAIVGGTRITANADRISGFLSALHAYPKIRVAARLDGDNSTEAGARLAEVILTEHAKLDAFFGINDPTSLGIAQALRTARRQAVVVSADGSAEVVELIKSGGPVIATAAQNPGLLGRIALQTAQRLYAGERPAQRTRLLPTVLISRGNADGYVPWG